MRRAAPVVVSVAVLAAVLWPAISPDHDDGFPISNYPMFATARQREGRFHTAVGVTADGQEVLLGPWHIGGSEEPMHAMETVRFAVADDTTAALCTEIARRLDDRRPDITSIEVRTDTLDAVAWFAGDEHPVASVVHSRCSP